MNRSQSHSVSGSERTVSLRRAVYAALLPALCLGVFALTMVVTHRMWLAVVLGIILGFALHDAIGRGYFLDLLRERWAFFDEAGESSTASVGHGAHKVA